MKGEHNKCDRVENGNYERNHLGTFLDNGKINSPTPCLNSEYASGIGFGIGTTGSERASKKIQGGEIVLKTNQNDESQITASNNPYILPYSAKIDKNHPQFFILSSRSGDHDADEVQI